MSTATGKEGKKGSAGRREGIATAALSLLFLIAVITSCGSGGGETTGIATDYLTHTYYDLAGNRTKEVRYYGAGIDGIWLTVDDVVTYYTSFTYDTSSNMIQEVRYYGPGADGIWFTADDDILLYAASTYDVNGDHISDAFFNGPGADGIWFTGDDEMFSL